MILVTGATGHIGNVLVRALLTKGEKVRAFVMKGEDCVSLDGLDVELMEGDVLDYDSLRSACAGVEVIYHLAGVISIMPGEDEWVHRVNVEGTRNVIRVAKEMHGARVIYTSSIHALQRTPPGRVIDESVPFDPDGAISAYDRSKALASLEVQNAARQGLNAVIVCPTGVIGPYDYRLSEMGKVILDALEERSLFYIDGQYDFVDVRDVAQGLILAGERGGKGEHYILSGEPLSVSRLFEIISQETGRKVNLFRIPLRLAQFFSIFTPFYYRLSRRKPRLTSYSIKTLQSNACISHAKAKRELGYQPRSLRLSIVDTIHWFLSTRMGLSSAGRYT